MKAISSLTSAPKAKKAKGAPAPDGVEITLPPLGWELVTFAPLLSPGVAFLGIKEKLVGAGALDCSHHKDKKTVQFKLTTGGTAVFYCASKPKEIDLYGLLHHRPRADEVKWDAKRKLLSIEIPRGGEVCVTLGF